MRLKHLQHMCPWQSVNININLVTRYSVFTAPIRSIVLTSVTSTATPNIRGTAIDVSPSSFDGRNLQAFSFSRCRTDSFYYYEQVRMNNI